MNPRQLHYVLTVAEEQSISAAAKKLYIAQPSLSALIRRVEEELGCELFDRTSTPLKLTAAGNIYIETVREMLKLNEEMKNRLRDVDENPNGKLMVGLWPNIGVMPLVMERFFRSFPNYDVEFRNSNGNNDRLRLLEQGTLELCIQPIYDKVERKFMVEEIGRDDLVLTVPVSFPVNDRLECYYNEDSAYPVIGVEQLRRLEDTPLALLDVGKRVRARIDTLFESADVTPHIKMINQKCEGCLDMAKYGVCATILPSSLVRFREPSCKVKFYTIDQKDTVEVLGAIYVRDRYLSKAAKTLISILKTI